jgi:hypothetical protein
MTRWVLIFMFIGFSAFRAPKPAHGKHAPRNGHA